MFVLWAQLISSEPFLLMLKVVDLSALRGKVFLNWQSLEQGWMKCLPCPGEDLGINAGNVFGPGAASEGGEMSDCHQHRHLCAES